MKFNREEFLERRRTGVGSSDAPAIMGVDDFGRTSRDVWAEKTGLVTELPETIDLLRGRYLEDLAAEVYKRQTGRKIRRQSMKRAKPPNEFAVAHLDRHVVAFDAKGPGACEIKCPRLPKFLGIKRTGVTEGIIVQVQHQLGVTGWRWADFCIFHPEQSEALVFQIDRQEDLIEAIFEREADFWRGHVLTGEPPPEPEPLDVELPEYEGELFVVPDEDAQAWLETIDGWAVARELAAEAKLLVEERAEAIQGLMTEVEQSVVEAGDWRFYWTPRDGSVKLNKKMLQALGPLDPMKVQEILVDVLQDDEGGLTETVLEALKEARLDIESDPRIHKTGQGSRPFRPFKIRDAS